MRTRYPTQLFTVVVVLALFSVIAVGQAQAPASGASDRFQTPWGDPDLQGMLDERHDYPVTASPGAR